MTRAIRAGLGLAALAASPAMALDCQRAATVSQDPYAVGAYAEGAFSCSAPDATLRLLARSDFPLP
jgi:hypothetical protein